MWKVSVNEVVRKIYGTDFMNFLLYNGKNWIRPMLIVFEFLNTGGYSGLNM